MLVAWPVVTAVLFQRMEVRRAFVWSILGAYMFLSPLTAIALPVVPDMDKTTLPNIAAAIMAMLLGYRVLQMPSNPLMKILIVLWIVGPWDSIFGNEQPLIEGITYRPAQSAYDAFNVMLRQAVVVVPLLMGRNLLAEDGSERLILRALLTGGLIYSLPMLVEVRLSPQINVWIYGYFAHDFGQMMRYGGYRPMVFMTHGLWVALFTFSALIAAAALARAQRLDLRALAIVGWMAVMLVICKSMAPILYALAVVPLVLLAPARIQLTVAAVLAMIVLSFPLLRLSGLVPVEGLIAAANAIDPDRALSLAFRLHNEDLLLARAAEKLWTGWGSFGRNLIVDPVSGEYVTIPDGAWIITMGVQGLPGYVIEFGLYTLPVFMAWRTRAVRSEPLLAALVLMHATMLIDLIPNATLTPLTYLLAGIIVGRVEYLRRVPAGRTATPIVPGRGGRPGLALPGSGSAGGAVGGGVGGGGVAVPGLRTIL